MGGRGWSSKHTLTTHKDSMHLGGLGYVTWQTHAPDTHTWREEEGLFNVKNDFQSDMAYTFWIYTNYSVFKLISV